jgi:hypothetical protein
MEIIPTQNRKKSCIAIKCVIVMSVLLDRKIMPIKVPGPINLEHNVGERYCCMHKIDGSQIKWA